MSNNNVLIVSGGLLLLIDIIMVLVFLPDATRVTALHGVIAAGGIGSLSYLIAGFGWPKYGSAFVGLGGLFLGLAAFIGMFYLLGDTVSTVLFGSIGALTMGLATVSLFRIAEQSVPSSD